MKTALTFPKTFQSSYLLNFVHQYINGSGDEKNLYNVLPF